MSQTIDIIDGETGLLFARNGEGVIIAQKEIATSEVRFVTDAGRDWIQTAPLLTERVRVFADAAAAKAWLRRVGFGVWLNMRFIRLSKLLQGEV
jgi:hypothetical protein